MSSGSASHRSGTSLNSNGKRNTGQEDKKSQRNVNRKLGGKKQRSSKSKNVSFSRKESNNADVQNVNNSNTRNFVNTVESESNGKCKHGNQLPDEYRQNILLSQYANMYEFGVGEDYLHDSFTEDDISEILNTVDPDLLNEYPGLFYHVRRFLNK